MSKRVGLKVELLGYTRQPEQNVAAAIRQCYAPVGAADLKKRIDSKTRKRLIGQVLASGHTSTIEHASFTFAIEGISRSCSHQLVRHRIASFSQQSQRYVSLAKGGLRFIIPPKIARNSALKQRFTRTMKRIEREYLQLLKEGVEVEDARFILPNACETKIVVTMNARSLHNFFRLRCCQRAQWEIRALAWEMLRLVKKVAPDLFAKAGPSCETEKICWEGKFSCGAWKKIKGAQLKNR